MIKGKWAVVKVESGIPVTVEVYLKWEDAKKREKYYRENMNLDNDETGVFELSINTHNKDYQAMFNMVNN